MTTKIGSQQKQSPEDNTGGGRTNTSASRYNQFFHECIAHKRSCLPARLYLDAIYIYIYICVYVYIYICIYVYVNITKYMHIYIYMNIHIYFYIYIYTYIFTYIYAHLLLELQVCEVRQEEGLTRTCSSSSRCAYMFVNIYVYIYVRVNPWRTSARFAKRRVNPNSGYSG